MYAADDVGVVVDKADGVQPAAVLDLDLLVKLTLKSAQQDVLAVNVVHGVYMPAYADGHKPVQPRFPAFFEAARHEYLVPAAQHHIRDYLLVAWVILCIRTRDELMLCADNVQHLGVRLRDKAGTAGDKLRQFLGFNYQYVFHSRLFSVDLFLL